MHMRIRYHFLADLHVTRHARETESEKRIRNRQNKPCRVELVTSPNRDYRPYAISENSFFIYHLYWEFTDGFVQGKPNIDEYFWIRSSVEVRNDTESAWIIAEGSRSRKLDFPNICNLFHQFSKYIKRLFARQCYWFISFIILLNEGDFTRPAPTRFLTSSVHVPFDTVFNQMW